MTTITDAQAADLWSVFQATAARVPSRVAVETSDGALTFEEVLAAAERLAETFRGLGIESGSVVHVALPNGWEYLPVVLALRSMDVAVGLVSSHYRDSEFQSVTTRMPPQAFVVSSNMVEFLERAIDVAEVHPVAGRAGEPSLALVVPTNSTVRHAGPEGLAMVKFTSGSSGEPKGVGYLEQTLLAEARNVVRSLGVEESDRILVPISVSHAYGFDLGLLPVILAGARVVLRRSFIPRELLHDLAHPDTSVLLGTPSMYRVLADTEASALPDLSHIRYLMSAAAQLPPSLALLCHERLGVPVCPFYGSSEAGAATIHVPAGVVERPDSVGRALDGVQLRILDDQGRSLPSGVEGEVAIRSHAVSRGYVTDEPAAREPFVPGEDGAVEYLTGDLGVIDDEGFLFLHGRLDRMINVGGLKVYPREVVQVLERCPGVSGARVFSGRDQGGEEFVHAVVALSQPTQEQDILVFCRRNLADYKVPRVIDIVESITSPEAQKMANLMGETS
jgi:acyl-CoA synthetase (AMP-forming)/AMP-acid ligase II